MNRSSDLAALSPWAPEVARALVSLDSDIALVIGADGVIRDVVQGGGAILAGPAADWIGQRWIETVTAETRVKIERLLSDVTTTGVARRREVNHPSADGVTIPVAYTAVRLGNDGPVIVVGRDLRAIAAIQQRFVEAQRDLERGYWSARQAEQRYRSLFHVATDAVLVVDALDLKVIDANAAASRLFDHSLEQLVGRDVCVGFERHSRGAVEELLSTARSTGRPAEIRARLVGTVVADTLAATPFRSDNAMHLLVRVREAPGPAALVELGQSLARWVDGAHEGVVITDPSGRVIAANRAFVEYAGAMEEPGLKGRLLADALDAAPGTFDALLRGARLQGLAQASGLRLRRGPVDVSAALLTEGDQECIGFMFGDLRPATPAVAGPGDPLARLGSAPLPELLREARARTEQLLIVAALARCGGDVAAAARLLGISASTLRRRRGRVGAPTADDGP